MYRNVDNYLQMFFYKQYFSSIQRKLIPKWEKRNGKGKIKDNQMNEQEETADNHMLLRHVFENLIKTITTT